MLKITAIRHDTQPLAQALAAEFGEKGGTIGRAPESTLALADPDRVISRMHAVVSFRGGDYVLRDHGTAVPIVVNGRSLGNGREVRLGAGDEIRIGAYTLRVDIVAVPAAPAPPVVDDADATLVGVRPPGPPPGPLEHTLHPTGTLSGSVLSWNDDGSPAKTGEIRTVIVASSTPEAGHAAGTPAASAPAAAAQPAAVPAPRAPEAVPDVPDDLLLQALLDGAGVRDLAIPGGLTPELMRELGHVLRETVQGVLDLLAARAMTKREVRADATMISAQDNNPLKFSPGAAAAITHLLMPRGEGFMPPLRAVDDAYASLRSHQLGFVAGMRAALIAVLARFDPRALESRFAERSVADSLMPMNHKAKLWDQFNRLHDGIATDAERDFHAVFGEEFLRAYQARVTDARERDAALPER